MILANCKSKCKIVVVALNCGKKLKSQLLSLGVIPDEIIEVVHSYNNGPIVVKVKDSKIMLGHSMATKIEVKPYE